MSVCISASYSSSSEETRLAASDVQGFKPLSLCEKKRKKLYPPQKKSRNARKNDEEFFSISSFSEGLKARLSMIAD